MSRARKFKRRVAPPKPKLPSPYPLMATVEDSIREVTIFKGASVGPTTLFDVDSSFGRHMQRVSNALDVPAEGLAELAALAYELARTTGMPVAQVAESIAIAAECGLPFSTIIANIRHRYPHLSAGSSPNV